MIALILPAVQATRDAARRAQCKNNLLQLGVGLNNYHDTHRTFPPGYVAAVGPSGLDVGPGWGWGAMLLPFVEQSVVWERIPFDAPPRSFASSTATDRRLEIFTCPSDWGAARIDNYAANFGRGSIAAAPDRGDGVFFRNSRIRIKDIEDGAATFLLGERSTLHGGTDWSGTVAATNAVIARPLALTLMPTNGPHRVIGHTGPPRANQPAAAAGDARDDAPDAGTSKAATPFATDVHVQGNAFACPEDFGGIHSGGSHFLFVDGSVRFLSVNVNPSVYAALATRAGGEVVSNTEF
jgi:prepilin-type processing-associated H-X9-DG protein